jgi:outer membrane protein OmpA-like peptidoglycan-associated protein
MKVNLLFAAILFSAASNSQNLVPNSSFEDVSICTENKGYSKPSAWFNIVRNGAAGYIVLPNIPAATGHRYMNFVIGNRENTSRQYWQALLLHELEKGKRYLVRISITGWDDDPNLNDIGLYFTNSMISASRDTLLQPPNYLDFRDAKVNKSKNGWFRLEKEYVATENDQIMIVGNFSARNYQEIAKKRYSKSIYLAILVDDIEIIPSETIACENCQKIKDSLYSISQRNACPITASPPADTVASIVPEKKVDTVVISDILFASSSYTLINPDSLERFRDLFKAQDVRKIRIIGYTDNVGTETFNRELSQKRAIEVAGLLSSRFNIPESIIVVEGQGISTQFTDKKKNRRVEVYIYH